MAKKVFGVSSCSTPHLQSPLVPVENRQPMWSPQLEHTKISHLYPGNHVSSSEGSVTAMKFMSVLEVITLNEMPKRFTKTLRTQLPPNKFNR